MSERTSVAASRLRRWCLTAVSACAGFGLSLGCIEPFETPSEYNSQRFLCSEEHASTYQDLIDECASDASCGGVLSFDGKLEGVPVTVESLQSSTVFRRVRVGDASELFLDRVDTFGASPYFNLGLQLKSIGGSAEEEAPAREMTVDRGADSADAPYADTLLRMELRLTSGGESVDLTAEKGGAVTISTQTPDELSGSFEGSFGSKTDRVEGCFVLFPTSVTTTSEG